MATRDGYVRQRRTYRAPPASQWWPAPAMCVSGAHFGLYRTSMASRDGYVRRKCTFQAPPANERIHVTSASAGHFVCHSQSDRVFSLQGVCGFCPSSRIYECFPGINLPVEQQNAFLVFVPMLQFANLNVHVAVGVSSILRR